MTISIHRDIALGSDATPLDAPVISAEEAAIYIERMCAELAGLSDRAGLGFLAYLLEVAREEALLHGPPHPPKVMHGELPPR